MAEAVTGAVGEDVCVEEKQALSVAEGVSAALLLPVAQVVTVGVGVALPISPGMCPLLGVGGEEGVLEGEAEAVGLALAIEVGVGGALVRALVVALAECEAVVGDEGESVGVAREESEAPPGLEEGEGVDGSRAYSGVGLGRGVKLPVPPVGVGDGVLAREGKEVGVPPCAAALREEGVGQEEGEEDKERRETLGGGERDCEGVMVEHTEEEIEGEAEEEGQGEGEGVLGSDAPAVAVVTGDSETVEVALSLKGAEPVGEGLSVGLPREESVCVGEIVIVSMADSVIDGVAVSVGGEVCVPEGVALLVGLALSTVPRVVRVPVAVACEVSVPPTPPDTFKFAVIVTVGEGEDVSDSVGAEEAVGTGEAVELGSLVGEGVPLLSGAVGVPTLEGVGCKSVGEGVGQGVGRAVDVPAGIRGVEVWQAVLVGVPGGLGEALTSGDALREGGRVGVGCEEAVVRPFREAVVVGESVPPITEGEFEAEKGVEGESVGEGETLGGTMVGEVELEGGEEALPVGRVVEEEVSEAPPLGLGLCEGEEEEESTLVAVMVGALVEEAVAEGSGEGVSVERGGEGVGERVGVEVSVGPPARGGEAVGVPVGTALRVTERVELADNDPAPPLGVALSGMLRDQEGEKEVLWHAVDVALESPTLRVAVPEAQVEGEAVGESVVLTLPEPPEEREGVGEVEGERVEDGDCCPVGLPEAELAKEAVAGAVLDEDALRVEERVFAVRGEGVVEGVAAGVALEEEEVVCVRVAPVKGEAVVALEAETPAVALAVKEEDNVFLDVGVVVEVALTCPVSVEDVEGLGVPELEGDMLRVGECVAVAEREGVALPLGVSEVVNVPKPVAVGHWETERLCCGEEEVLGEGELLGLSLRSAVGVGELEGVLVGMGEALAVEEIEKVEMVVGSGFFVTEDVYVGMTEAVLLRVRLPRAGVGVSLKMEPRAVREKVTEKVGEE